MAKPTGGLLAFDARGQIGKTIVYSSWRGRKYVRQWVTPANPRSASQQANRQIFSFLSLLWKALPGDVLSAYKKAAQGKPFTDRNVWIKANLPVLAGQTDLNNIITSTGAGGGIFTDDMTVTPGATQLTVAMVAPPIPVDWTVDHMFITVFAPMDPETDIVIGTVRSAVDTSAGPYQVVVTGLTTGVEYVVSGYFAYVLPSGPLAYARSTNSTGIPT